MKEPMLWLKQNKTELLILLALLLIAIPAVYPLFHKGFFVTDDGEWMIIRFSAFYTALRDGQFPVRFLHSLNSGFGYPVPTFLYPGFMYLGIPIQIITSNFVNTIKIIIALSLIGSSVFMYFWLNKLFSKTPSFLGAVISLYIPYHLYDVYTRGSVGEILSFVFVPFILWMIEKESIFFTALGISLLILSHNTLAVLFIPLIILYGFLNIIFSRHRKKKLIYRFIFALILGFGMSSFFVIPAVFELPLTVFSRTAIANPLRYFADEKLIGQISVFIFMIALVTYIFKRKKITIYKQLIYIFLIFSIVSMVMSSAIGNPIWKIIPSSWIQFPFRLLSFLIISIPFLLAFVLTHINGIMRMVIIILVCFLTFSSTLPFSNPKEFIDKGDAYYFTNQATTTVHDEYMPIWIKQKPIQMPNEKVVIMKGKGSIEKITYNNKKITFTTKLDNDSVININTIYWPGWTVYADGKKVDINYSNPQGIIQINIPKGKHAVEANFSETSLRLIGDIISVISFLFLVLLSRTNKLKLV